MFALTTKLFGDDNNPYVRITGSIIVTQCIFVQDVAGPQMKTTVMHCLQQRNLQTMRRSVWALFLEFYTIVLRSSNSFQAGCRCWYGVNTATVNGVGGAFGLIPDAANLIVLVLGGVILYPATAWALGVSFQTQVNIDNF